MTFTSMPTGAASIVKTSPRATELQSSQPLYDADFYTWATEQTRLLRAGRFDALDLENLIEEVEDLAKRTLNALESNTTVLIHHLLKWRFRPTRRTRSWQLMIVDHRQRVQALLRKNPSLAPRFGSVVTEVYPDAVARASTETGLPPAQFDTARPFLEGELLDPDLLPDAVEEA